MRPDFTARFLLVAACAGLPGGFAFAQIRMPAPVVDDSEVTSGFHFKKLNPKQELGKALFGDGSLSAPAGQSCLSCHVPETGFTFPDSDLNLQLGVAPGVVPGRFGFRAVPQVSYAAFGLPGPTHPIQTINLYVGGTFWDGRAADLKDQAQFPFVDANEMNNLTHNLADPSLVVQKVAQGPNAAAFKKVYGPNAFNQPTTVVYKNIADAIAAYEKSPEVSPFSSKYDAWLAGKAEFTPAELLGLQIVGSTYNGRLDGTTFPIVGRCSDCHVIPSTPSAARDIWTATCFQNIGVPKNPDNPFYKQTDAVSNPVGYNPLGEAFVDYGLGGVMYPQMGLPPGNFGPGSNGQGDFLAINGLFKAPSLRNVDKRPYPGFVKAYMHNGVFKSLEQVVHFYNTRNLTTEPGEVIDFANEHPYEDLVGTPLWGVPEHTDPETMVNASGDFGQDPIIGPVEAGATVGNMGFTAEQEAAIVAFLKTLTDGYFDPALGNKCMDFVVQPKYQLICRTGAIKMVVATTAPEPLKYQWRKDGVPIPGANTSFYEKHSLAIADSGLYDCVVTGPCDTITSMQGRMDVCAADYDCSGGIDDADLEAFEDDFANEGARADINEDGSIDLFDFFAFIEAYQQGC